LAYKYTLVYSLSQIIRKTNLSLLSKRERKRKDTLLRLEEFRLWKTQGFRFRLVISCRTSDSAVLVRTASARRLTEQLVSFYPLNITLILLGRFDNMNSSTDWYWHSGTGMYQCMLSAQKLLDIFPCVV
jgi:hypothetical protein